MVLRAVAEAARALELRGRRILVAVSGGIDSTVLLGALHASPERFGFNLSIGHVNHALRGEESEADETFVRDLADRLGLPIRIAREDPRPEREGRSSRERPTLQEAARRLRYRALERMASDLGAERIATGHTADDQAETVLLRLLRGTGPDGLGGIPERSPDGRVVRPLLRVSRAEIEHFARSRGIQWREDSSNASDAYARNRLRAYWLPALAEAFGANPLRALGDLAEAQRRDSAWIASVVEREGACRFHADADGLVIDGGDWAALPEALARRLARLALERCGARRDVSRVHLERVVRFLREGRAGKRIELPGGLVLACRGTSFRLGPGGVGPPTAC